MTYYDSTDPAEVWKIVALLLAACISFYWQAVVTEERLIPSLNVISKCLKLSDDVAGATLMAGGSSAPELFAALISTFVIHSSLGLGTVAGSAVFNQLFIPAIAILAAKNNTLILDPIFLCRDVIFYMISLIVLFLALLDRGAVNGDNAEHVYIQTSDGILLIGCYLVYVVVCAKFDVILKFLRIETNASPEDEGRQCHYEIGDDTPAQKLVDTSLSSVTAMPFLRSCGGKEPSQNFHIENSVSDGIIPPSTVMAELYRGSSMEEDDAMGVYGRSFPTRPKSQFFFFHKITQHLKDIDGINDIEKSANCISFHLWQRSSFYDKVKIDMNAWHLRWFTFSEDGIISSVALRQNKGTHEEEKIIMPFYSSFEVDEARLLIKIQSPRSDTILLAPSDAIFHMAVSRFEERLRKKLNDDIEETHPAVFEAHHTNLIEFPSNASKYQVFVHIVTYPVKFLIHMLVPNVCSQKSATPFLRAFVSSFMSVVFLIIGSYAMVLSLEDLASRLHIPDTVIGATISAAGTSLPSCIASQIAASLGLGNMAVGNVFGSNTFNILLALGFPWLLYTLVYGKDYTELSADGINESMIAMIGSLFLFLIMVFFTEALGFTHSTLKFPPRQISRLHATKNEKEMNPLVKSSWYAVEAFGKMFGKSETKNKDLDSSKPPSSLKETLRRIELDNERFYFLSGQVDKLIYAENCVFSDPFVSFVGRDRFVDNLKNLGSFITKYDAKVLRYDVNQTDLSVDMRVMVKLELNLPWKPILAWPWGVLYEIDAETFLIKSHRESWDIAPLEGVKQIFRKPTLKI